MTLSIPTVWMLWAYGTMHSYCSECCGRMALSIPIVLNALGVWHYPFLLFWMLWAYGTNTADQSVRSGASDRESCGCVGYRGSPPPPLHRPQTPIGQVAGPSVLILDFMADWYLILWLTDTLPLSHVLIFTVTRWAFLLPILHGLLPRTLLNVLLFWCCKSLLSQRQLSVLSQRQLSVLSQRQLSVHTPSAAFRHLPPNSARFGYATEGALFISAQLSTDAVSALRKVWVLIYMTVEAT